ncbi:heterokaryon incompatibility protein-domain-containing protein [Pyrenochaeta sp. MPI-SDFR-AT-0127]|nr:heterokaryon incompatibility protein-domain-containing protein [Pyrenochaeta sp. MPI-SDFR-AT-0127]
MLGLSRVVQNQLPLFERHGHLAPQQLGSFLRPSLLAQPDYTTSAHPLDEPDSIRLLVLHPGPSKTHICCSLIHTTLSECREDIYNHYVALSYVWGPLQHPKTILLNNHPFKVTANLASALADLRDEQRHLRLWADAICIDQGNILERSEQVMLMGDIYSLAHHTVAHVGESNDAIDEAFITLHTNETESLIPSSSAESGALITRMQELILNQILTRPWFDRVWIYQELVLSPTVWLQCGRSRVHWDDLRKLLPQQNFSTQRDPSLDTLSHTVVTPSLASWRFELLAHMHDARQKHKTSILLGKDPATLLEILLARRGFGATDQRDMIYGHMAVARLHDVMFLRRRTLPLSIEVMEANYDEHRNEFDRIIQDPISDMYYAAYLKACHGSLLCSPVPTVDYRKSISKVFTEVTRFIMDFDQSLHTLLHAEAIGSSVRGMDLPSWVPDWSLNSLNYPTPLHSCCSPLEAPPMITFAFSKNAPIFVSLGTIRGTLSAVSPIIKVYDEDIDKEKEFHSLSQKWVIKSGGQYERENTPEPEREELYRQVYDLWRRRLGDVPLAPYRKSHTYSMIWDSFDWVNYQRMLEKDPSLIKWSLKKPQDSQHNLRDASLEQMLMKHPFTIFSTKILNDRKVAMYHDEFLAGYCVVPANSRPGAISETRHAC